MKGGQQARRLEVPSGSDHFSDRSNGGGAARARRAQGQPRRRGQVGEGLRRAAGSSQTRSIRSPPGAAPCGPNTISQ